MKKTFIAIGTIILSLILTFLVSEIFSLYHFGSIPTRLTLIYLISLFSIFEYLILSIIHIIGIKRGKQKITNRKIISMILFFISLLLILNFIFATHIDWLNYYSNGNSAPFYFIVIGNGITILLPSALSLIVGIVLIRKKK